MGDSYTNRMHSPSHEMWSYERFFFFFLSLVRVVVRQGFYCRINSNTLDSTDDNAIGL